jgi:peptidyl-prolyl cis-trans isomerase D
MLDTLRRGAASWIGKILVLIPLVIAFAIWGIADVFRGYGQGEIARVGKSEITVEEFQRAYRSQIDAVSRQFGRRLTPEQARAFGVERNALMQLVGGAAVDSHARELNLALSDEAIAEAVRRDPIFQGTDGKFSKLQFDGLLRQVGLSERAFLASRRRDELRDQVTSAMVQGVTPPAALLDLLYRYREETRVVDHFTIDPAKLAKIAEPDDAALRSTYDAHKRQFVVPESRKLAILYLTEAEVKTRVPVEEAAIRAAFDADKEAFNDPEKRKLQQIAFKDRVAAEAALKAIRGGKSFLDAAKEAGARESDVELGTLTKKQLIDPKIADAAFALAKDAVSEVIEGRFAIVLLKALEIEPGKVRSYEEVKDRIRDRLAGEKARDEIQKLHDQVDDNKAGGKTLKDIAELLKLRFVEIAGTDRSGKAPDGKPALEGPDAQRLLGGAFDGQVGAESEAVELSEGGYAWVDILAITPEKQKEFAEVRDDVKAVWIDLETRKVVADAASRFAERAAKGEAMATLAGQAGGKVETTAPFRRFTAIPGLTEAAVSQAFALPMGRAGSAETQDGKSRVVFLVKDVVPAPPAKPEDTERLRADVIRQMQGDALQAYVAALQARLGVTINEAELRRVTGGGERQP